MKTVFADTGYWIAILNSQDNLHQKALTLTSDLSQAQIFTSEMVLTEVLNYFAKSSSFFRQASALLVESIRGNPNMTIISQTDAWFQKAFILYKDRLDQTWSHTDCASFCIMKQHNILEALAYDKHFEQAGFIPLLR